MFSANSFSTLVSFSNDLCASVSSILRTDFQYPKGPNTLTFIVRLHHNPALYPPPLLVSNYLTTSLLQIPAEIFPTKYRCTCHGISAASGKLGSLAVQGLLSRPEFGADPTHFRIMLGCFAIPMTLGAIFAWGWLPSLQEAPLPATRTCEFPTVPSKTLETLAKGRKYATGPRDYYPPGDKQEGRLRGGGEILSFKGKLCEIRRNVRLRLNGGFAGRSEVNGGGAGAAEMLELNEVPMVNGDA
jgi:hypothetical protein